MARLDCHDKLDIHFDVVKDRNRICVSCSHDIGIKFLRQSRSIFKLHVKAILSEFSLDGLEYRISIFDFHSVIHKHFDC
ncbi:uncharacterized protein Z518_00695 [Rhinocladiella mackenziei CBS 650.93]|uniref:Uncharacterized protein n=1 Tax=Rhinocladiella mackenziei CBS 650.93 TaxID=1442369 RepID=A0A0D2JJK5_9EURO|nr:uncharacterized protein Z518_00695 [Rhinocladiella mackenziei CBS 650.93]KIX09615.1 hypothetical protein Z518_00695 [Rhinocladiella mackenziei CBS 650.93]